MKTLGIFHDYTGCTLYRVISPFHYANALQPFHWVHRDDLGKVDIGNYDVLMLPRFCYPTLEAARASMRLFHASGRILVYELDDDLLNIPAHNPASAHIGPSEREAIRHVLGQCHAVVTTNEYLARVVGQYNPEVYVIPNFVDPRLFAACARRRKRHTRVSVGASGSASHAKDWEVLARVWPRLAERFPQVDFVACGYAPPALVAALGPRLTVHPWKGLEHYQADLADIDIGCAPLLDDHFNRSKTPIKVLEYALAGAASVASPVVYSRVLRDGENGLFAEDDASWEHQISRLIVRTGLRRKLAGQLAREAETTHTIQRNAWRWAQTFTAIEARHRHATHAPDYALAERITRDEGAALGILPNPNPVPNDGDNRTGG